MAGAPDRRGGMVRAWLRDLAAGGIGDAALLWPDTPAHDIQAAITRRVGASDLVLDDVRCRSRTIIHALRNLLSRGVLAGQPVILDVCCGDGIILWQLKRAMPHAYCYGIDIRRYDWHDIVKRAGVHIWPVPLQRLVQSAPPTRLDITLTLNTIRDWASAGLSPADSALPEQLDGWLCAHTDWLIATLTEAQCDDWLAQGYVVTEIGPGEDASRMCLVDIGGHHGAA